MKEKLARYLGPEQWLSRIGLAAVALIGGASTTMLKGWWGQSRQAISKATSEGLLIDTVAVLLLLLILLVLSWWFYSRSVRFRSSGFMGHTPRRFRGDVLSVLRAVVDQGDDDAKIPSATGLTKETVLYAMGELRSYGWVAIHLEEWGTPSVYHYATPAGRKVAVENPKKK